MSGNRRQLWQHGPMRLFLVEAAHDDAGALVEHYELEVDGLGVVASFLSLEEASIYLELMAEDDAGGPLADPVGFNPPPCPRGC